MNRDDLKNLSSIDVGSQQNKLHFIEGSFYNDDQALNMQMNSSPTPKGEVQNHPVGELEGLSPHPLS